MWYLNDLYVVSDLPAGCCKSASGTGAPFAKETDALTVKLETAVSNHPAKLLYESEGYQKITAFDHYPAGWSVTGVFVTIYVMKSPAVIWEEWLESGR
ncbi:hypothetical protein ACTG2K_23110 [Aeromonas caviae]